MKQSNDSANTRAHTTAATTKAGKPTTKIHPAYQALYGQQPEPQATTTPANECQRMIDTLDSVMADADGYLTDHQLHELQEVACKLSGWKESFQDLDAAGQGVKL